MKPSLGKSIARALFVMTGALAASGVVHAADKPKLCISTWDLTNPYWVNLVNGAKQRAAEVGAELVVNDPSNDAGRQLSALENFITVGCKAIIVAAIDTQATKGILPKAKAANVKVIAQSMEVQGSDIWASADEREMGLSIGLEAGKWIKEKLGGKAQVLVLNNDLQPQMIARKNGIREGIMKNAPGATIVADQTANGVAQAMQVTENVLQANPNVKVIAGINDAQALGALAAVESQNKAGPTFFIGGVDATPEARAKINGGTAFRASVDNVPFDNGKMNVDFAMRLIKGEKLAYRQIIPVKAFAQK